MKTDRTLKTYCSILVILLCGAIISMLVGCFPTAKRRAETQSNAAEKASVISDLEMVPDTVKYESKTVCINANVVIPYPTPDLYILSAVGKSFCFEDIQKILPEDEVLEENPVPDEATQVFLGNDGGMMTIQPGCIYYRSGRSAKKQYSLVLDSTQIMDGRDIDNGVFKEEEIEGFSRQEVVDQTKQWLNELGIDNVGEPNVVVLDFDTLSKEYESLEESFAKEGEAFEKDDEGYYLIFRSEYKDIPLLAQDYYLRDKTMCFGSVIKMIVTRSGLQQITMQGIYDINEVSESQKSIYDFNLLMEAVKVRYQDVILAEPVKITKIELIYAPDVVSVGPIVYKLSPCWAIYATTGKEDERANIYFYYSALTGEELEIDSDS